MKILEHTHQFETEPKSEPFGYTLLADVDSEVSRRHKDLELKRLVKQIALIRIPPYLKRERGGIVDKHRDLRNRLITRLEKILRIE